MNTPHYIIRGGVEGRERLRVLSRILHPLSITLLRRAGARTGMYCLEAGCGGGDIATEMASMVGAEGKVMRIRDARTPFRGVLLMRLHPHSLKSWRVQVESVR